jgi:hypothetical protein
MSESKSLTSPRGELRWVTISGKGKTDLNGRDIYTADLIVSAEEAKPLVDAIAELWESGKPKGAKDPKSTSYKVLDDGTYKFVFKTSTKYPSGDDKKISVFDAKARPTDLGDKRIGNGSIGRLAGAIAIYDAGVAARGVTAYLDSVQLLKLVEYSGGSNSFSADDDYEFSGGNAFDEDEALI